MAVEKATECTYFRWSQEPDGSARLHPEALAKAKELESRGYTQHSQDDLQDQEGVVAISCHTGAHGPARYFRRYKPDDKGVQLENVLEAYPDSPFASSISLNNKSTHIEYEPGRTMSKIGMFRLNSPEHIDDIFAMYRQRATRHQEKVQQQKKLEQEAQLKKLAGS
jgi:hypothetical protein